MKEANFLLDVLNKFGFPVAFAAGCLFVLWWTIKSHRQERAELYKQSKQERDELAKRFQILDDRADKKTEDLLTALKDLEIVIKLNNMK